MAVTVEFLAFYRHGGDCRVPCFLLVTVRDMVVTAEYLAFYLLLFRDMVVTVEFFALCLLHLQA